MNNIAFVDTEIQEGTGRILDIGSIRTGGAVYHSSSVADFIHFLQGARYICGHNLIHHDLKYIHDAVQAAGISGNVCLDTLYWSPLLFPMRPYHALLKDDKLQTEELNNPLNDAIKARELFMDEVEAFRKLSPAMQHIYYFLLNRQKEFSAFFDYLEYQPEGSAPETLIRECFAARICEHADLGRMVTEHPVELAYALAMINTRSRI
ncbi:hypothetical protein [Paenibacillus typhae]|uniref:ATP-dependent DNA helicase RecQ n=1 Tax=Paenibacillus typhae TaxID=1174501 RepID=A0A1G8ZY76_9BACL|nr:hypothetical protein [Paenibacillus typhae]SDK19941.1 ATP-dependent DNA helicase RecQ [Paenibacillus typhae]